jgi:PTH1 family peptidyl-tRNA hydrolase
LASRIQLIVGLGNPGREYEDTRHNAGFWFVDRICSRFRGSFRPEGKFKGELAKVNIAGDSVWLLKPDTYMNLSGDSVAAVTRFYKIPVESILVAHDELDLNPGAVRLKKGGGHGGHNGLRDTISKLGSKEFMRLRIGIGHPGNAKQVSSFVLKKAPSSEQNLIEDAIEQALAQVEDMVGGEHQKVMNRLHSK